MTANGPAPELPETARLLALVARLRAPGGCPWDREQTLDSLKPHLIEECYELLEAVEGGQPDAHREELGDVLLQVALQAQIRDEEGRFTFEDVARVLADKLVRRHPHVFGDVQVADSKEVLRNWEALKAAEHGAARPSRLDGVPAHLPALLRAQRLQAKAARAGFDWTDEQGVLEKLAEEAAEVRAAVAAKDSRQVAEELGDLLFTVVNLCRFAGVQAEDVLRHATAKFARRFQAVEGRVAADGRQIRDLPLAELNRHWEAVKAAEGTAAGSPESAR